MFQPTVHELQQTVQELHSGAPRKRSSLTTLRNCGSCGGLVQRTAGHCFHCGTLLDVGSAPQQMPAELEALALESGRQPLPRFGAGPIVGGALVVFALSAVAAYAMWSVF